MVIGHDSDDDSQALALYTSIEVWLIPRAMWVLKPLRQHTTSMFWTTYDGLAKLLVMAPMPPRPARIVAEQKASFH